MTVESTSDAARSLAVTSDGGIAIVVLTHNRAHLLPQCVENVLLRTSDATREIVIWDNGSTDGTAEYLSSVDDPRVRVVHSPTNVGFNAYADACEMTSAPFFVELDDDVVDAPAHWDLMLRDSFVRLPHVGYLAADLEDDPKDEASYFRHHIRPHEYVPVEENGVRLLRGPAGGGCAMTARELIDRIGGFRKQKGKVFWLEDQTYIEDIAHIGFQARVLPDLVVKHTGGPHYTDAPPEKKAFWARYNRRLERRASIKRWIYRAPLVPRLNARFGWFQPPT